MYIYLQGNIIYIYIYNIALQVRDVHTQWFRWVQLYVESWRTAVIKL